MAVDLRMAAEDALGVDIPLMSIAGGASLNDVALRAVARIAPAAEEAELRAPEQALAASHGVAEGEIALVREASRRAQLEGRALG
jgi:hypothetical protein